MKLSSALVAGLLSVPSAVAWGSLGHITTAFIASHFVSNTTEAFFQELLQNDESDYLAGVATWADSIRYTQWGRFTKNFHFIDAHDNPPESCNVDYERDCKESGCVISALANYTKQSLDAALPTWRRAQAAKFVIHFIGDLHQPLHNEDVALGGNRIYVQWDGRKYNLHHIWDSSIAEKWIGGLRGKPYPLARKWANELAVEIADGKFAEEKKVWLKDLKFDDPISTALAWSRECNAYVCTHVLPEGPKAIAGEELGGDYFEAAGPIIEKQVARAGFRMAAWLDRIASEYGTRSQSDVEDEL
ncbi:hypothetical protein ACO1O0_005504 [Amphichorda felina]